MKIENLIATMNYLTPKKLISDMNIKSSFILINQITEDVFNGETYKNTFNVHEKGLSKSRNMALKKSKADICVISDDDLRYKDNYLDIIKTAYQKYPDASVIAFHVDNINPEKTIKKMKEGKVDFLHLMKISSVQITFKRENVLKNNIKFDLNFGSGSSKYINGEENIFLADCYKSGLKVYYVPLTIATIMDNNSSWFKGYNEIYFKTKGAVFYKLSKKIYFLLILQFIVRKYRLYKKDITPIKALKLMLKGAKEVKKNELEVAK